MKTAAMNFKTTVKEKKNDTHRSILEGVQYSTAYKSKAPVKRSHLINIDNIDYLQLKQNRESEKKKIMKMLLLMAYL